MDPIEVPENFNLNGTTHDVSFSEIVTNVVRGGVAVGSAVTFAVGVAIGSAVTFAVGVAIGSAVTFAVGVAVGSAVTFAVGVAIGSARSNSFSLMKIVSLFSTFEMSVEPVDTDTKRTHNITNNVKINLNFTNIIPHLSR